MVPVHSGDRLHASVGALGSVSCRMA